MQPKRFVQPEKEIEKRLVTLEIEAKERRKKTERNIIIVVLLAVLFSLLSYSYPQYVIFIVIDILIITLGVIIGIVFIGLPILARPLRTEYRAFQRFAHAIQVLEKSQEPVAYREVLRDMTYAYNALSGISLTKGVEWYNKTNEILDKFLENLEKIVLPAIQDSVIRIDHLEEIALAVYSLDPAEIDAVNKTLEAESSYKKSTVELGEGFSHRVSELLRTQIYIPRDITVIFSMFVGCIVFYAIVYYLGYQKDTALVVSVAAFLGLLAIYVERRRKPTREMKEYKTASLSEF